MTLLFIRVFFLIIISFVGAYIGSINDQTWLGIGTGFLSGIFLILLETSFRRVSVRGLSSMVFGLLLGVLLAKLVSDILSLLPLGEPFQSVSRVVLTLAFSYLGAVMALREKDEFSLIIPYVRFRRQDVDERMIILDTSAIIDGRITDIYKTNFFIGRMVIPRFVIQELQKLADSESPMKREKGRRGLDIIRMMQKDTSFDIKIHEEEVAGDTETDAKLVRLAKIMEARLCTTDFNLSRVAAIQGVKVLNVSELASAMKPVIFDGEELDVKLIKEGRSPNQAVAYTDDGVMIVVADAKALIGQRVKVTVTSTVQSQGGKIVFAKVKSS